MTKFISSPLLSLALFLAPLRPCRLEAQALSIDAASIADTSTRSAAVARLASEAAAVYRDSNQLTQLDNLFRLQLLAGHPAEARATLSQFRSVQSSRGDTTAAARALDTRYEIYLGAQKLHSDSSVPFADAFARAFRERLARLDDRAAALVIRTLGAPPPPAPETPWGPAGKGARDTTVALTDAVAWLRAVQNAEIFREVGALAAPLIREDDSRRYVIQPKVRVKTPDGATVCADVWRPRQGPARLPALLQFTIYADTTTLPFDLRRNASNGYAAVIGFTRGKACSPDQPVPYVHDGPDAMSVIEWIARQPWSDGQVGMYGGSYSGMSPWSAAKRAPPALKAIMVGAPVAPGLDVPMEGNIVWNFVYPWPFYTTDNKWLDDSTYNDQNRWNRLYNRWYADGRAYRELDKIDGTPNPVWHQWIAHPSYDRYWQAMIPYKEEFARIKIPVLQTAGYYFGGPGAAMHYLTEHYRYSPHARDYLVVGPYGHFDAQRGVVNALADTTTTISGYEIDPVARIDIIAELRYPWFDWILKGGPRPTLLGDRINYEVIGANQWKHAPSVSAMSNARLRFYLSAEHTDSTYRLQPERPARDSSVTLTVDLRDRSDSALIVPGGGVQDSAIYTLNSLVYVSDPLSRASEISGLFKSHLEVVSNKRDFDFGISIYEKRRDGTYLQLPPYQSRASYVADVSQRRLLTPGKREVLDLQSIRLASHLCRAGSRIVVVLGVNKSPGQQINYGTGKSVNDETVADAGEPLIIRWSNRSWLELPVRR
ncbi:MAG: CocE/NonD family hydrolase [Gemmatimonadales bacterium]